MGDTLYLPPSRYNIAKILDRVRTIAENNGMKILKEYNRTWKIAERNGDNIETVRCLTCFGFTDMEIVYKLSFDDNPFFPFDYLKTKITDGTYSADAIYEEFNKDDWFWDCFFSYRASEEDLNEAANIIYNNLMKLPMSKINVEYEKIRVLNTYNSEYHYEKVRSREIKIKVEIEGV